VLALAGCAQDYHFRTVDTEQRPLASARVWMAEGTSAPNFVLVATSNRDGEVELRLPPKGTRVFAFEKPGYRLAYACFVADSDVIVTVSDTGKPKPHWFPPDLMGYGRLGTRLDVPLVTYPSAPSTQSADEKPPTISTDDLDSNGTPTTRR
jgi:hypothetical protein